MKIIICPDSFKGSLKADEVANTIAEAIREKIPTAELIKIPLADGGEGTGDILSKNAFKIKINIDSYDSLRRDIKSQYYLDEGGKRAFIESAGTLGLTLLSESERNPRVATSYGLGIIINDAIRKGCTEISVSLGGSAVCDGGIGMLAALGYRFLDKRGNKLEENGENLSKIVDIDASNIVSDLNKIRFNVICDVRNPLLGNNGTLMFATQKGATHEDMALLEKGLVNLVDIAIKKEFGDSGSANIDGAGAAGGLGYAFYAFLNGKHFEGFDYVLKETPFENEIIDADLIITGEGKIDAQSLMGKVVGGILAKSKVYNVPVIAVGGIVENKEDLLKEGFKDILQISNVALNLEENMKRSIAIANLKRVIKEEILNYYI